MLSKKVFSITMKTQQKQFKRVLSVGAAQWNGREISEGEFFFFIIFSLMFMGEVLSLM